MIDWIIMGIIFAIIIALAMYIIWKNSQRRKQPLEGKSFLGWIADILLHIH